MTVSKHLKNGNILIFSVLLFYFMLFSFNVNAQIAFTDVAPTLIVNDPGNGQGTVFLDINNDGFLDIFLVNNGQANKLWKSNSGTTFTEVGVTWGVNYAGPGRGCSGGDFNNDGNIDIMVGNFNALLILYKSTGTAFTNFTTNAGVNLTTWGGSLNWFDYNNDGKLDAIFGNDGVPYHYNYLFKNENLLSFTEVANASGITDFTSTLTIASADYDNDGDLDLFCGTQTAGTPGTNFLYRNNGNGTFTNVTSASGLITLAYTWGSDWGDFDNDGDMDLYIANYNYNYAVNQLYRNNGNNTFTEVGVQYGVADPTDSYSCGWADYDNDGDLDMYVANGQSGYDKLYRNDGSTFVDVAATVGTHDIRHSSCISWGDFNNDGFMDVYLVNNGTENRLYKNNAGNSNKWVILKLRGVTSNRSAIGARVKIKTGSLTQIREVSGGSGGKGQNSLPVEFGLGSASIIDSIIIRWPSGLVQGFANIPVNQIITAIEGQPLGVIVKSSTAPEEFRLEQNYPNPFNPTTRIDFSIPVTGMVTLKVYDMLGKEISTLVDEFKNAGIYTVAFVGTELSSGTYFYRMQSGDFIKVKRMMLVK